MNVAALVSRGLAIAQRVGVAGTVTVSRVAPGTIVPDQDQRFGDVPSSFTATGAIENKASDPDAPMTGGTSPTRVRLITLAAADCAFPPASGMTVTIGSDTRALRVMAVDIIETVAASGLVAAAYTLRVAG